MPLPIKTKSLPRTPTFKVVVVAATMMDKEVEDRDRDVRSKFYHG